MSTVTLKRFSKVVPEHHSGKIVLNERVSTLCVKFTDGNGNEVSLAFDGRPFRFGHASGENFAFYNEFADCPVQLNGTDVQDVSVVRALRDALNTLDLGDE